MHAPIFLKLGGSLITDKTRPHTARMDIIRSLAGQLAAARRADPGLLLLLGHGSGSFGHVPAKEYRTRQGIPPNTRQDREETQAYWYGFNEVWQEASALNHLVMAALREAGLSAMAFPPSANVSARDGQVAAWDLTPLRQALGHGILPVVYGDVVFDEVRGGTILSTEELFMHLARELHPQRVLLAGLEDGVYADFPARRQRVAHVTPHSFDGIRSGLGASAGTDVTGGMIAKVAQMLALAEQSPQMEVRLFSAEQPERLMRVLAGESFGTLITAA